MKIEDESAGWVLTDMHHKNLVKSTRATGIAFVGYTLLMGRYEATMIKSGGTGIIGLELAGNAQRATEILDRWGPDGTRAARISLHLDFGYMSSYGIFTALLAEGARRRHSARHLAALHRAFVALPAIAVLADAYEGMELLRLMRDSRNDVHARRARSAARLKFAALTLVLAYWAVSHRHP